MSYNEFINRFEVFENPPSKKGYDRHHIVPESEQTEPDNRQIYCSLPMHMWLHILYDREHGTNTASLFLKLCGKPVEYFDCFEKCLAYSYTLRKKREERDKKSSEVKKTPEYRHKASDSKKGKKHPMYGQHHTEEARQKISDSMKGEKNPFYGQHHTEETKKNLSDSHKGLNTWSKGRKWFNNGTKNIMAYECPEGYVPGRLKS